MQFFASFTDPAALFGHFTYLLLIISMLMRRMVWLRTLAVGAGLAKIVYRAFFVFDPISVFWEAVFVLVNIGQLLVIWYFERHHRFHGDEKVLVESLPIAIERRAVRRLLRLARSRELARGEALTREGEPVSTLSFVASGVFTIARGGEIVAACGPGDYVGELSFLTGQPATATATATKPARVLQFEQAELREACARDDALRRVLEMGLNRNLAGKLSRPHQASAGEDPLPSPDPSSLGDQAVSS